MSCSTTNPCTGLCMTLPTRLEQKNKLAQTRRKTSDSNLGEPKCKKIARVSVKHELVLSSQMQQYCKLEAYYDTSVSKIVEVKRCWLQDFLAGRSPSPGPCHRKITKLGASAATLAAGLPEGASKLAASERVHMTTLRPPSVTADPSPAISG